MNEIADATEEEADRRGGDNDVAEGEEIDAPLPAEQRDGNDDAERAAMERHAAMPDLQRLQRIGEIVVRLVEEDVAEPPAEDDTERRPYEEIVDRFRRHETRRALGQHEAPAPADDQPGDIGEGIPADDERAELDQHRIDRRIGNGEERHRRGLSPRKRGGGGGDKVTQYATPPPRAGEC